MSKARSISAVVAEVILLCCVCVCSLFFLIITVIMFDIPQKLQPWVAPAIFLFWLLVLEILGHWPYVVFFLREAKAKLRGQASA